MLEDFVAKPLPTQEETHNAVVTLIQACYGRGYNAGWWHDPKTGKSIVATRNVGELLCLVHSEISEAMEGYRKSLPDDKLPEYPMFEVELADALIRIFDLAGARAPCLADALIAKMKYNESRADHKHENRVKAGGKAF